MKEDLDRLLAYRNFLAAEDHLDELLFSPSSEEEQRFLQSVKNEIEYFRDDVMPKEVDSNFHCIVKHLSLAYEACREVAKATHDDLDQQRANAVRDLLNVMLEKLWGRKILKCERCKLHEPRGIQTEGAGNTPETFDDGLTGNGIQGVGVDREPSLSGRETGDPFGDEAGGTQPNIAGREAQGTF